MKSIIYTSDFRSGPEATEKQQKHFATDVEFAYGSGYRYIKDNSGTLFLMESATSITESDFTEDEINALYSIANDIADAIDESEDESETPYCIECHNLMLIDQVINNTLKQANDITPQQAETMLRLAQLKSILQKGH